MTQIQIHPKGTIPLAISSALFINEDIDVDQIGIDIIGIDDSAPIIAIRNSIDDSRFAINGLVDDEIDCIAKIKADSIIIGRSAEIDTILTGKIIIAGDATHERGIIIIPEHLFRELITLGSTLKGNGAPGHSPGRSIDAGHSIPRTNARIDI